MTTVEPKKKKKNRDKRLLKEESVCAHSDSGEVDRGALSPSV